MLEVVFWVVYLTLPVAVVWLLRIAGERINRISLISLVVASLYLFSVVGTLPLFYQWDDYRAAVGVTDQFLVFQVLIYSGINLIFFLFGIILVKNILGLRPFPINSKQIIPLNKSHIFGIFCALAVSLIVLLLFLRQLSQIALFVALEAGAKEAGEARSGMGNDFAGKYHWYKLLMYDLSQFLSYALYANWLVRRSTRSLFYFCIAFSLAVFVAIMATEKGPLAWFLIGLFITHILVKRNGYVSVRQALKFIPVVLIVLVLMYMNFMGSADAEAALSSVFSRTFTGQITPAYFYLQYFPDVKDYLLGGTFPNPGGILPFTPFRYTVEIMDWLFPHLAAAGVVGSAPTVFWGEAYANFGPIGIPIVAVIMGVLTGMVNWLITRCEMNPLTIGFLVWVMIQFHSLSGTGFSGYIVNVSLFAMTFIYCTLMLSNGRMVIRKNNAKRVGTSYE